LTTIKLLHESDLPKDDTKFTV